MFMNNSSKTTDELLDMLNKNKNISQYFSANEEEFVFDSISDYLNHLLSEKNLLKAEVIKNSAINTIYAYQIFQGLKLPSRDKLLQLAFGFGLNLDEAQRLLKIGGGSALYPRNKRDSVVIHCLINGKTLFECDEILYEMNEKTFQ
jgi:hypothetical protein